MLLFSSACYFKKCSFDISQEPNYCRETVLFSPGHGQCSLPKSSPCRAPRPGLGLGCSSPNYPVNYTWSSVPGVFLLTDGTQRCKNVWAYEQCWLRFFPSLGKISAKFYAVLSRKWEMLQFHTFWVTLMAEYL